MLEIKADIFQNLSYGEEQFRTEALTVKGEYLKNNASPIRKLLAAVRNEAFDKHTYKHTTMGFLPNEAMPDQSEYGQTFSSAFYKPEYVSLVIVGDVDPQATIAMVKKHWGNWQQGIIKPIFLLNRNNRRLVMCMSNTKGYPDTGY